MRMLSMFKTRRVKVISIALALVVISAGAYVAFADPPPNSPVPRTIAYDGTLEQDGSAVEGTYDFHFRLLDSMSTPVWPESDWAERSLTIGAGGRFTVDFPDADYEGGDLPDEVFETRPLYLRIQVKETSESTYNTLSPDVLINSVPFAVRAERAVEVDTVPTGMIAPFFGEDAPYGWLVADGSTIDSATDPELADLVAHLRDLGAEFQGTETTQAILPDLRGVFLRGQDLGAGVNPEAGADTIGLFQDDEVGPHTHSTEAWVPASSGPSHQTLTAGSSPDTELWGGITVLENDGTETRPKNVTVLHIIKY